MRRLCFLVIGLVVLRSQPALAVDSQWLAPLDGDWADATNWSTDPNAPIGAADTALLDAAGAAYTATVTQNTSLDTVTINSADATLQIQGAEFIATGGIQLNQGTLNLRGGTLSNTRVDGGGSFVMSYNLGYPTLHDVTLATDAAGPGANLSGEVVLENAELKFRSGTLATGGRVTGTGTWMLGDPVPSTSSQLTPVIVASGGEFTSGPGVLLTPGSRRTDIVSTDGSTFVNQGTVVVDQPEGYLRFRKVRNEGTMSVSNGGILEVNPDGNVGQIDIQQGGYLRLTGDPFFNVPLVVGNGARLLVTDSGSPQASGQAIQLQAGGEIITSALSTIPRIAANGGEVLLGALYTVGGISQLPITGSTTLRFASNSLLDMEGNSLDYTTLPQTLSLSGARLSNGTLTGPITPVEFGHPTSAAFIQNVTLDVPGIVSQGTFGIHNASTLAQPFVVNGGELQLHDQWVNAGGITVDAGTLGIDALPADPLDIGSIVFNGGQLRIGLSQTLTELQNFPIAAPQKVTLARADFYSSTPVLDLEMGTLDLTTLPYQLEIDTGRIINGTVLGDASLPTLPLGFNATADAVTFDSLTLDASAGYANFSNSVLRNSTLLSSSSALSLRDSTLESVTISGDVEIQGLVPVAGHLEVNDILGGARGSVFSFAHGATLGGTGIIGNTLGRIEGQTLEIVDPQFTIPASLKLVAATQYDTTDIVDAPSTALRVEADVVVGFENPFPGSTRSDSMTFDVASLETTGKIDVNVDGTLNVNAPWQHTGELILENGLVIAQQVTIASAGSLVGDGTLQATGGLDVEGAISPGETPGTLNVEGDLTLASTATLAVQFQQDESATIYNELQILGSATLGGLLEVSAEPEAEFAVGELFPLLTTTGGIFLEFDQVELPNLPSGKALQLFYGDTIVGLEVIESADFNFDDDVDHQDLAAWQSGYGNELTGENFLTWQQALDSTSTIVAVSQQVPETSTFSLVFLTFGTFPCLRRRARA